MKKTTAKWHWPKKIFFNFIAPALLGTELYQFTNRALESNSPIEAWTFWLLAAGSTLVLFYSLSPRLFKKIGTEILRR